MIRVPVDRSATAVYAAAQLSRPVHLPLAASATHDAEGNPEGAAGVVARRPTSGWSFCVGADAAEGVAASGATTRPGKIGEGSEAANPSGAAAPSTAATGAAAPPPQATPEPVPTPAAPTTAPGGLTPRSNTGPELRSGPAVRGAVRPVR